MSPDMEEIGQLVQTVLESTALGKDSEEMQQQEGFFLNLLHEEGAVKVTVHWEVDEWSPAGGVAAEDEHPGSFTAGAMTLALFSAGNENHLLSLNRRSFSDSAHLAGMANSQQHGSGLIQEMVCAARQTPGEHTAARPSMTSVLSNKGFPM
eukprot:XP_025010007.1 uncharacterized protein LOC112533251 isoform X6 [Gallus gallus]